MFYSWYIEDVNKAQLQKLKYSQFVQNVCRTVLYFDCEVTYLLGISLTSSSVINDSHLSFDMGKLIQCVYTMEKQKVSIPSNHRKKPVT